MINGWFSSGYFENAIPNDLRFNASHCKAEVRQYTALCTVTVLQNYFDKSQTTFLAAQGNTYLTQPDNVAGVKR